MIRPLSLAGNVDFASVQILNDVVAFRHFGSGAQTEQFNCGIDVNVNKRREEKYIYIWDSVSMDVTGKRKENMLSRLFHRISPMLRTSRRAQKSFNGRKKKLRIIEQRCPETAHGRETHGGHQEWGKGKRKRVFPKGIQMQIFECEPVQITWAASSNTIRLLLFGRRRRTDKRFSSLFCFCCCSSSFTSSPTLIQFNEIFVSLPGPTVAMHGPNGRCRLRLWLWPGVKQGTETLTPRRRRTFA